MGLGFSDGFKPEEDVVYCYGRITWIDGKCQLLLRRVKT